MLQLISILKLKNAFHALTDASPVRLVMIVLNADLTTPSMPNLGFVLKFVVMEKDTLLNVMMETMLTEMGAVGIAELKWVSHVSEVHQLPETHAVLFYHQPLRLKIEASLDFLERLS